MTTFETMLLDKMVATIQPGDSDQRYYAMDHLADVLEAASRTLRSVQDYESLNNRIDTKIIQGRGHKRLRDELAGIIWQLDDEGVEPNAFTIDRAKWLSAHTYTLLDWQDDDEQEVAA